MPKSPPSPQPTQPTPLPQDDQLAQVIWWILVLLINLVVLVLCCCSCRVCWRLCGPCRRFLGRRFQVCACCRRGAAAASQPVPREDLVQVGDATVSAEHLRRRKELRFAYFLWLSGGLVGAHHFYLGRLVHGILSFWSLNFLFLGWVLDMLLMPLYVGGGNWEAASIAPRDGSCRHVCLRLVFVWVAVATVYFSAFAKAPHTLHSLNIVDMERVGSNTTVNPYDLLQVSRDASRMEIKTAYQREVGRLPKGERCDAACRAAREELQKAARYVTGDAWRRPRRDNSRGAAEDQRSDRGGKPRRRRDLEEEVETVHDPWDDWADHTTHQWKALSNYTFDKTADAVTRFFNSWEAKEAEPESRTEL